MKNLIIYFSYSGTTRKLVTDLNKHFSYDVVEIDRKVPYSLDYDTCAYKEAKQEIDELLFPEITSLSKNVDDYDRILLFFPIWWYTMPRVIATLCKKLKGYKGEIVLFENSYTNDPQYAVDSLKDFKNIDKNLKVSQGLFNKNANEHIKFIESL